MKLMYDVIELAKEIEKENKIDFGYITMDEDDAYRRIANEIIQRNFETPAEHRDLMLLATCTHLVLQNLVLHAKIQAIVANNRRT